MLQVSLTTEDEYRNWWLVRRYVCDGHYVCVHGREVEHFTTL